VGRQIIVINAVNANHRNVGAYRIRPRCAALDALFPAWARNQWPAMRRVGCIDFGVGVNANHRNVGVSRRLARDVPHWMQCFRRGRGTNGPRCAALDALVPVRAYAIRSHALIINVGCIDFGEGVCDTPPRIDDR
jgi:hypothetical protein